ncbi:MAG: hypothetical protein C5S38_07515 [Candidatus Methanophagaceae archaeon]|nr:MAG: hypothetical protein C5S38_07515 [Methanophagales archaeon]
MFLFVAVGSASAQNPPITDCRVIDSEGLWVIDDNITNSTADVCIYITSDNVILDGQGHYINGSTPGDCEALAVFPGLLSSYARPGIAVKRADNVTIKNVEVKNFCTGILLYGPSEDNTVETCTVHHNGNSTVDAETGEFRGIVLHNSVCNSTINNNMVYNTSCKLAGGCDDNGAGINIKKFCNHNNATNNTICHNDLAGIYSKKGGGDCYNYILNNTVYQNGQTGDDACFTGGIRFQCKTTDDNRIENNTVTDNFGPGIFIGGNDCIVRNNTVTWNKEAKVAPNSRGDGLRIDRYGDGGGKNTQAYDNIFCDNEHLDINVENTAQNVVGDDNICDTCSNYNDEGEICCTYNCSRGEVVGCVVEDGTVFGCGDRVTKSCVFNGTLSCEAGHGLVISADNITIDGNSYTLDGLSPGACDILGINRSGIYNSGYDDVLIKNLEIKNFCNGIYLNRGKGGYVYRNIIENCNIHHNGNATSSRSETHGIKMRYVFNSTIRNNSIHHTIAYVNPNPGCEDGGNGLFLYRGDYNNIIGNMFYNNSKAGMLIKMKPKYWNISHNHLWDNGQGGIILRCMLCGFNLIECNNASDNYGSGIFIGGNTNIIRYNTVCNNRDGGPYHEDSVGGHGYGINIGRSDGSLNNTLISNTVCENDYLDIYVVPGVIGNVGDENICDTSEGYDDEGTTGCTFSCEGVEPVFDTSKGTYPSISGTHKGKIITDKDITVNRMYTYASAGTGGHTEYVRIWNESENVDGQGNWSGYPGDYHNVTISPAITLLQGHTYNYTIETGSYPQIVHAKSKPVTGGNITCTKFTDANGKEYENGIPAIRLFYEGQ